MNDQHIIGHISADRYYPGTEPPETGLPVMPVYASDYVRALEQVNRDKMEASEIAIRILTANIHGEQLRKLVEVLDGVK